MAMTARRGEARRGEARRGEARRGEARRGEILVVQDPPALTPLIARSPAAAEREVINIKDLQSVTARLQAAADAVDVLVIDLTTSNGRAPASLPAFNWEWPLTVTIVLVANGDQQTTLHAMERGSYVVLENSCSETELHAAITLATMRARQLRACATAGLRALRRSAYQLLDEEALFIELLVACLVRHGELSPAEARVTSCLLAGLTRDEIAAATNRSPQTIRTHSRAVLRKLGLELRRDLWPAAIRTIGSEWKVIAARVPGDIQEEPKASQPATRRKKRVSGFLLD